MKRQTGGYALLSIVLAAGCGGPPKQVNSEDDFGSATSTSTSTGGSESPVSASPPPSDGPPPAADGAAGRLNRSQNEMVQVVLKRGATKAAQCPDVVPGAPSGEAEVKVTFDGKKGRSVDASVGPPFAGTPIEACIKRAFIDEIVMPFDGPPLEMTTNVKIAAKAAAPDPKGKKK